MLLTVREARIAMGVLDPHDGCVWESDYRQHMGWARKIEASRRYDRSVAAIVHAIYLRNDDGSKSVLYHIRGNCGDDCRWCQIG